MIQTLLNVHLYANWQILILIILAYICGILAEIMDSKVRNRKKQK